jgi:hypothetical protein
LYILDLSPLLDIKFASILSDSIFSLYLLFSFAAQKFWMLMKSNASFLSSVTCAFRVTSGKTFSSPRHEDLLQVFSISFIILAFTCMSMIHFEFILVYGIRRLLFLKIVIGYIFINNVASLTSYNSLHGTNPVLPLSILLMFLHTLCLHIGSWTFTCQASQLIYDC